MSRFSILVAAGSLFALAYAAPASSGRNVDTYRLYLGTAESQEWPSKERWFHNFESMFSANVDALSGSCTQFNVPNNSEQEIGDMYNAINQVSGETGVDSRFIFAVMMQESSGCVRAPTTSYGVRNPGLMQSHNGVGTCNEHGAVQNPCPASSIVQMIRDGAAGTPSGDGLAQLFQKSGGSETSKFYQAARMYNSGSIDPSGDLGAGIATHCYSSDIANRLTGWVRARKTCNLDGTPAWSDAPMELPVADSPIPVDFYTKPAAEVNYPVPAPQPAPAVQPAPVSPPRPISPPASLPEVAPPASRPVVAPPMTLQRLPAKVQATSNMMAPGVTTRCAKYYRVEDGDFCLKVASLFSISFEELRTLNSALDGGCGNLWKGYDYCVEGL